MGNLEFGTSHFINIKSAITYYEDMGFSADDVREKLIEGEIHVGEPEAWAGHRLRVDEDGRFHQVWDSSLLPAAYFEMYNERPSTHTFKLPDSGWDSLNKAEDHEINEALKEANKAMDNRTTKMLDWIYAAREVMLIINGVMLFGIICYLIFLGV